MFAHAGGVLATDLTDVTTDLTALDSTGFWAVVITYEGKITCARFGNVRSAPLPYAPWRGPSRDAWSSSLDRSAYVSGVETIRAAIAEGTVYQANLCRVLSAPLPGADLLGLGNALAAGNPAPYGAGWPELISATFPPGSITGAPKSSALTLLNELEPVPRGPYCGAIGWVDADSRRGALAVGIRTFWAEDDLLRFGTGAGITWHSDPLREWRETELKAARLLEVASR